MPDTLFSTEDQFPKMDVAGLTPVSGYRQVKQRKSLTGTGKLKLGQLFPAGCSKRADFHLWNRPFAQCSKMGDNNLLQRRYLGN
jgi:hypothetical protein